MCGSAQTGAVGDGDGEPLAIGGGIRLIPPVAISITAPMTTTTPASVSSVLDRVMVIFDGHHATTAEIQPGYWNATA